MQQIWWRDVAGIKVAINFDLTIQYAINLLYLCNNKQSNTDMARPIKETPILFGSDARRFEERMQNPPKVSPEKRAQIRKSYEAGIKMLVK